jgi:ADP-heptose:LPS heptosyltransferase
MDQSRLVVSVSSAPVYLAVVTTVLPAIMVFG